MTDKKWNNKEEFEEVKKLQKTHEQESMDSATVSQRKLYEECKDPIQKARYKRGLDILERGLYRND